MISEKWFSVDEISSYLSVRRETVYRWIKNRNLPAHKIGTVYKARLADIDAWIIHNTVNPPLLEEDSEMKRLLAQPPSDHSLVEQLPFSEIKANRHADFQAISQIFATKAYFADERNLLLGGDSLEILRAFPDRSISLIVTDPPYHTTQKSNILGDTQFDTDEEYLTWFQKYLHQWKRILRPNGSIYCFCSVAMAARLEVAFRKEFNILGNLTWTKPNAPGFDGWKQKMNKEALRQWYPHSERIIFAEPAFSGNLFQSYFGNLLKEWRTQAKLSMKDLTELVGAYGKVNHGGSVANWEAGRNIPSQEQYTKIVSALSSYLPKISFPPYCDVIRAFHTSGNEEFTDIWNFPNIRPYKGKHPAEKPIAMLEHIIHSSSYLEDIVLDCFSGSGSTAIAALRNNRFAISIELDPKWLQSSKAIFQQIAASQYSQFPDNYNLKRNLAETSLSFTMQPSMAFAKSMP